jgi:hypothetical protein
VEPEPTLKNGAKPKSHKSRNFFNYNFMQTVSSAKTIYTDICVSVWVTQQFEVPLDYEIKGSTPKEAYERLISEFGDQNVDAVQEPCELDLMEVQAIDFSSIGDEFISYNNLRTEREIKRFES